MAVISSSPSPPTLAASAAGGTRPASPHLFLPILSFAPRRLPSRLAVSSRLFSSRSNNGSVETSNGSDDVLHHSLPSPPLSAKNFAPVFVTLPVDAVGSNGRMTRRKTMGASFMALAAAGVEGVAVEVWWGVVERESPGVYDWDGYLDLVALAGRCGLKVRAIMAFHQCRSGPCDPCWIPLPWWVLEEMDKDPDLVYTDRFGRRSREYISLGCDTFPVLKGRSPIQAYSDFMRSFRDTFRDFLGVIVTEIQIGMGPAGELRYPSCPAKLMRPGSAPQLGEFQCYDKYMLASLNARARNVGMQEWGNGGPVGASNLLQNPEETSFFRSDGSWNTAYGHFFLEWYSGMLLLHGERLCMVTDGIFLHSGVKISAKVAGIHWHYYTCSHPSELTAGYYNTLTRDGYLPIVRMLGRYRMTLCCTCFDMQDSEEQRNSLSSPEGYLRQLVYAARMCNLPLLGENSVTRLDDTSLKQVIKSSRLYSNGSHGTSLSFNYVRMNRNLFDSNNWTRFTRFVRQMSDSRTFKTQLDFKSESCLSCASANVGEVLHSSERKRFLSI